MDANWLTIPEAARLYRRHPVTLYKLAADLAAQGSEHTKREGRTRYLSRTYLDTYTKPKTRNVLEFDRPILPPSATQDEVREAIRERLEDLRQALEHERAIARSLADQNAQLVEQNRRLLEQVDDLTAMTLRLGMGRRTQSIE